MAMLAHMTAQSVVARADNLTMDSPVLLYLQCVASCRHLIPAVLRWASPNATACLDVIFAGDMALDVQAQRICAMPVNDNMALLAKLVLPNCDMQPALELGWNATAAGHAVLQWVCRNVFPAVTSSENIMQAICTTSVLQAHQAQEACLAALLVSVSPTNALSMLDFACNHGLEELAGRALEQAIISFPEAAKTDPKALTRLPAPVIVRLLQDDSLPCPEDEVMLTLMTWCTADSAARSPLLAQMATACVRLSQLSIKQVEQLDQHPLINESMHGLRVVAGMYIAKLMGSPLPLGLSSSREGDMGYQPAADRPRRGTALVQLQAV